jgi:RNA polymerase sigma-70 factor, ECF subfamily
MTTWSKADERPLGGYRDYLRVLARLQMNSLTPLQGKLDDSDVVQQTILLAHARRSQFRGTTEAEWLGWLRSILANVLRSTYREFDAASRKISRELSLEFQLEQSSARLHHILAADQSTPSGEAARVEELLRLAQAIVKLPEDQRRVVELHHLQGLPVAEVADLLGRTRPSVVGLLFRALKRLRELLDANEEIDE